MITLVQNCHLFAITDKNVHLLTYFSPLSTRKQQNFLTVTASPIYNVNIISLGTIN